MDYIDIAR